MTIKEAILKSLTDINYTMTVDDIYNTIDRNGYYIFSANKPKAAISPELSKLYKSGKLIRSGDSGSYKYSIKL